MSAQGKRSVALGHRIKREFEKAPPGRNKSTAHFAINNRENIEPQFIPPRWGFANKLVAPVTQGDAFAACAAFACPGLT
jgi:hypothetical protein